MIVQWRGWGVSVGLLFVFWFFAVIVYVAAASPYIPDPHKAAMDIQWGAAAVFALYALSVQAVIEVRRRNPQTVARQDGASPEPILQSDEFIWIRLVYWPAILFAVALFFVVATYYGYEIFGRDDDASHPQPRIGTLSDHAIVSRSEG